MSFATGGGQVFAYCRVSTAGQAERDTIQTQLVAVEQWAKANGVVIAKVFTDEGISGSLGLDHRLGLADALDALKAGDTLVVYKLDRLARDMLLQEQILRFDIWAKKARIVSCSQAESDYLSDDPSDPTRALLRQIVGAVAEYERKMIKARTMAGRRRRQSAGGFVGGGVTFGYHVVGGMLVEKPGEIELVREMHQRKRNGASYGDLAEYMTATTRDKWLRERCFRVLRRYRAELDRQEQAA